MLSAPKVLHWKLSSRHTFLALAATALMQPTKGPTKRRPRANDWHLCLWTHCLLQRLLRILLPLLCSNHSKMNRQTLSYKMWDGISQARQKFVLVVGTVIVVATAVVVVYLHQRPEGDGKVNRNQPSNQEDTTPRKTNPPRRRRPWFLFLLVVVSFTTDFFCSSPPKSAMMM